MEDIKCKKLIATFQDDKLFLEGPKILNFVMDNAITITIEQIGRRTIKLESEKEESFKKLYESLTKIERLLMIFDGKFINLKKISFADSEEGTEEDLKSCALNIMRSRLPYYESADFCNYILDKLVDYNTVITDELFNNWQMLLDELDIVHQMFLYSISACGMPVDAKCAFLIELAEPLVEIVKTHTNFFASLTPGERGTSLKMCLDVLISKYGTDIYDKEIACNYEKFLQTSVNSRIRIMHIKRKQKGLFFNGKESALYAQKIALLYRKIIFEILEIPENAYIEKLKVLVKKLNKWNDIQENFLAKLNK